MTDEKPWIPFVAALDGLRLEIAGTVLSPGDDGFVEELAGSHLQVTHDPAAVVIADSTEDVAATLRFARQYGVECVVQSTGHGTFHGVTNGLVLSTRRLTSMIIDAESRTATIGAGVQWKTVIAAAADHGLAPIAGASGGVGVPGLLLGGGLGPLSRTFGYGSDWWRSATVVSYSGSILLASADENAELLWGLRGGKYGLGIVTDVTIELVPIPALIAGGLFFDTPHIDAAARHWLDWTASAPEEIGTSLALIHFPDIDDVPPFFRGKLIGHLRYASVLEASANQQWLQPLKDPAPALLDTIAELPLADVASIHNDPTEPSAAWSTAIFLDSLDRQALDSILAGANSPALPFIAVELRHLGGATARNVPEGSAVSGRGAEFALTVVGLLDDDHSEAVMEAAAETFFTPLQPHTAAYTNANFAGEYDHVEELDACWTPAENERLAAIREAIQDF